MFRSIYAATLMLKSWLRLDVNSASNVCCIIQNVKTRLAKTTKSHVKTDAP